MGRMGGGGIESNESPPLPLSPSPLLPFSRAAAWPTAAFVLSFLLTWLMIHLAPRIGLVDHPSERKVHTRTTPRGGGLAIFLSWILLSAVAQASPGWLSFGQLAVLTGILVGVSAIDDWKPLPWYVRLVAQFGIAWFAVENGPGLDSWLMRGLAIFWVVGLINASNMIDNMDALSAGCAWIAVLAILAAAMLVDPGTVATAGRTHLLMLGAVAGFLYFNRPPARIFMGDGGSTLLGFFLGIATLDLMIHHHRAAGGWWWLPGVCFVAVHWYDLVTVVSIRLAGGLSPFHADKRHLSHRLVERGWRPTRAVALIHLLGLASGTCGAALYAVLARSGSTSPSPPWPAVVIACAFAAGWCLFAVWDIRRIVRSRK